MSIILNKLHAKYKGSVIFYQEVGLLKIGGSGTLSKIKRGIKRFFKLKGGGGGDHLYFLKK